MKFKQTLLLVAVISIGKAGYVCAADGVEGLKSFTVTRTKTPPSIDGHIDDAVWQQATPISDFHQNNPQYREAPSEKTVVRILYDDDFLYVSVDLLDGEAEKISATQLIQGRSTTSDDRFHVSLDSFNSKRNDYMFSVNANGVRTEALREANSRFIADWTTIWEAATAINDDGWTAELAIPFKSISFDPNSDTWGINFGRWIIRKQEFIIWSSNEREWWATDEGEMSGIEGLRQGLGLDVVPTVNVIQRRDYGLGTDELEFEPSLDLSYKITPSLNSALTINTDFSATEVDEQQVALDRFSLFFPEKRDFFLQDAGIFEFGGLAANGRPFFSRRIGLSAGGQPIGIDVGGKLTGRSGNLNLGVLGVRQEAFEDVTAEDLFVGRASINVLNESQLGMIVTSGDPTSNESNTLVGTDFIYRNSEGPFGQLVLGNAWFQQTDSPGMSDENKAFGAVFQVPNDRLSVKMGALEIQQNFNPALGFVNRPGIRQYDATVRYRTRPATGRWRTIDNLVQSLLVTDMQGEVLSRLNRVRAFEFASYGADKLFIEWKQHHERVVTDFPLFGRLDIPAGKYDFDRYRIGLSTGVQRPLSISLEFEDGEFFGGDRRETVLDFQWRQSAHFFVGLGFRQNVVDLPSGSFTSHLGSLRTDVAFNSRWSWSNFIQYDNVSEALGVNSRLRFEPVAGRELLLVLNHSSGVELDNSLFSIGTDFILKMSYTFRY